MMQKLLRLEAFLCFVGLISSYLCYYHASLWWLMGTIWLPDISMVGYLRNPRWGAYLYNTGHHLGLPVFLWGWGLWLNQPSFTVVGVVWASHIYLDRLLGYGLKYPNSFRHTHLTSTD